MLARLVKSRLMATAVDTPKSAIPKAVKVAVPMANKPAAPKQKKPAMSLAAVPQKQSVQQLAQAIYHLNLLETTQLVTILKRKLKLPDMVAAAPMASAGPSATAANAVATPPPAPAAPAKTEFTLTLEKFDPSCKAKVIKEVKAILTNLNLVEAKAFVEGAPKVIKEKVKKEEAEKLKKALEDAGATITMD